MQQVYTFGGSARSDDPRTRDKSIVAGKGANLAEMAGIGLPVPPGFTITTEECVRYLALGADFSPGLKEKVAAALGHIERTAGKGFGDAADPLLVPVRSGARVSMPGMMDTVLNLGLNDETVQGFASASGDARFAWDSYRRFIQMYSDVVLGLDNHLFEDVLEITKEDNGFYADVEMQMENGKASLEKTRPSFAPNLAEFEELAEAIGIGVPTLKRRAGGLHEFNPMLGHRGGRLGNTFPEIYEMQARALFEAACDVAETGDAPVPEAMIPLVATRKEIEILKALVDRTAAQAFEEKSRTISYHVVTMIELPRAALMAGEIAEVGEFISFGTNDLTQTTSGLSRDDAGRFLPAYAEAGVFARDPFVSLDIECVGKLIDLAAERGRASLPGSSSASAVSTGQIRPPLHTAKGLVSTTSRPRHTACRLPGWRRRRLLYDKR